MIFKKINTLNKTEYTRGALATMALNIISTDAARAVLNVVPVDEIIRYLTEKGYVVVTKDLHENLYDAAVKRELNSIKTAERARIQREEEKARKIAEGTYKGRGRPRKYPLVTSQPVPLSFVPTNPAVLAPNLPKFDPRAAAMHMLPPQHALVG